MGFIGVGVKSNFKDTPFPSMRALRSELAQHTRPTIAARLVKVAKAKIGHQQGQVVGALSGQRVEAWKDGPTNHLLYEDGKIIKNRIKAIVTGEKIIFGTTGNSRYATIQWTHEMGGKIPITEKMLHGFFLDGKFVKLKKETVEKGYIIVPPRSYIRGTVYFLEKWIQAEILKAMKKSMGKLTTRGGK